MFKLSKNVPEIYVNESRDFQLLCDSFDVVQNSIKFDIDSMLNTAVTTDCSEVYLEFLARKLGFYTKRKYSSSVLRVVLASFPYLVRNKGSNRGIWMAINIFLHAIGSDASCYMEVMKDTSRDIAEILIKFSAFSFDTTLLTDLLQYVLPAGYKLKYEFYSVTESARTSLNVESKIAVTLAGDSANDVQKEPETEQHYTEQSRYLFPNKTSDPNTVYNRVDLFNLDGVSTTALFDNMTQSELEENDDECI